MTDRTIVVPLATIEGVHLASLLEEFLDLLRAGALGAEIDPAFERLVPSPYPDDTEASQEFADAMRDDLLDRRAADAALVRTALDEFVDDDGVPEGEPLESRDVLIPDGQIDAWIRTLNALRLVIATRLGIVDEDRHDEDDPRFGVYDWLGFRLDGLVQAADAQLP